MGCAASDQSLGKSVNLESQGQSVAKTDSGGQNKRHSVSAVTKRQFHEEYVLQQKLGKGAFAAVYLAHKADSDSKMLAVKVSDLRQSGQGASFGNAQVDMKRQKAAIKEIEMLEIVMGHRNIIQCYESFIEEGLAYVVMEKCDHTLLQVLERMPALNEDALKPLFSDMLTGLMVVHERGIVHRDVKPDNFLCRGQNSTVKLCDFGLAVKVSNPEADELIGVNGTPPFMSPEMLMNKRYSSRVDTWSFGVIVYTLVFGRFPYTPVEQTGPAMKAAIVKGMPAPSFRPAASSRDSRGGGASGGTSAPSAPALSPAGMSWLRELLAREPMDRPTCKEALAYSIFTRPQELGQRPPTSLRTMLNAAKRCGAFDVPLGRGGKQKETDVDVQLRTLQERHRPEGEPEGKVRPPLSEMSTEAESEGTRSHRSHASRNG